MAAINEPSRYFRENFGIHLQLDANAMITGAEIKELKKEDGTILQQAYCVYTTSNKLCTKKQDGPLPYAAKLYFKDVTLSTIFLNRSAQKLAEYASLAEEFQKISDDLKNHSEADAYRSNLLSFKRLTAINAWNFAKANNMPDIVDEEIRKIAYEAALEDVKGKSDGIIIQIGTLDFNDNAKKDVSDKGPLIQSAVNDYTTSLSNFMQEFPEEFQTETSLSDRLRRVKDFVTPTLTKYNLQAEAKRLKDCLSGKSKTIGEDDDEKLLRSHS